MTQSSPGALRHSEKRLSSADDPHPAKTDSGAGAVSNEARVTPEKIRDFLRLLARQIAMLARSAGRRAQTWWSDRRALSRAAGISLRDRWSGWQARLQSWTKDV